jgi:hypothetical protein
MRGFICITFFVLNVTGLFGQETVTPEALRKSPIKDFEVHAIDDRLLISFRSGLLDRSGKPLVTALIVKPDRSVDEISLPTFLYGNVIKVEDADSALNFFYLTTERDLAVLRKVIYKKSTKTTRVVGQTLTLSGNVVGAFHTPDLLALSKNKSEDSLILSRIKDLKVIDKKTVFIPEGVLKTINPSFIKEGSRVIPAQANALLKFFLEQNQLTVVNDRPRKPKNQFQGFTDVIHIDLNSGKTRRTIVGEPSQQTFRTFYCRGILYKVWKGPNYNLAVFKGDTVINMLTLRKDLPFMTKAAFKRTGADYSVSNKPLALETISGNSNPFVIVYPEDERKVKLMIGSHSATSDAAYVALTGGLVAMVNAALATSITSANYPTDDVDKYFYLKGNAKDGFNYDGGNGSVNYMIDSYEQAGHYQFRKYLQTKSFTFAFYRKAPNGEIEVVRFNNP